MKLCSYVVKNDTGFAPNPFWGYCTLAACTPNHMGIRLNPGDWIIGTETVRQGNKLIYAMKISEKIPFEQYYADRRFKKKKPVLDGSPRRRCGDNIYYKKSVTGKWQQHCTRYHNKKEQRKQDLKHPYVFIAKHFYYFGCKAKPLPPSYRSLVLKRHGVKCNHDPKTVNNFLSWLQARYKPGRHGNPRDAIRTDCKAKNEKNKRTYRNPSVVDFEPHLRTGASCVEAPQT